MLKKIYFICFFIQLIGPGAYSQYQTTEIDSTLLNYYNRCTQVISKPEVLLMADTLFEMAEKQHNAKMQVVALCTKLDYYYYLQEENNTDSIILWANRVKQFARDTHQPRYYYFAWSSRLIRHYIGLGEYNIALLETEKMLHEAEAEDYKEGIADCYYSMTVIYSTKEMPEKTMEFILKEIDLFEKYQLDRYNISLQYSNAVRYSAELESNEKTPVFLEKAIEYAKTPYHKVYAKLSSIHYYLAINDISEAARLLEESRKMFAENTSLTQHLDYLYNTEFSYYEKIGMYDKALEVFTKWADVLNKKNQSVYESNLLRTKADLFWKSGKHSEAAGLYRQYLENLDKERVKSEEITTAEFATLLNMQRLTAEKNELAVLSQKRKLQNTNILIISLGVLLIIVSGFMYHQRKLYKKIKKSRDQLNEQNQILQEAKEELKHAKDMAEQSSRMKTVFIQSMSHEIRTPLNSIVGFSDVLANLYAEKDDEVRQYTLLIEENSRLLLKMITDILDISALDEMEQEVELAPVDIRNICLKCLTQVRPYVADGVKINFIHPQEHIVINTNESFLLQVLGNLLDNAAKFTARGEITLAYELCDNDKQLSITVADTGIGIPEDKQEYIFERFVKLDEFSQGTGLGLSICKMIAEKLGGSLILEKNNTIGSCFVFSVPVCK